MPTTILIVDDNDFVRAAMRKILEARADFQVCGEATNGRQAVEKFRALRPDCVVLDFSMPVMNGIDATRQIHDEFPFIQIFGLSAHERSQNLRAMRRAGGADYFIKGVEMQRLIDRLLAIQSDKAEIRKAAP